MRMVEMCMHHPMFQFLFDESGQLLAANKMALMNMKGEKRSHAFLFLLGAMNPGKGSVLDSRCPS